MQIKRSFSIIKNNLPEILGVIISSAGLAVIAGWFFNIGFLKSILPIWVSMKFSTALLFFFSGIQLYFIARFQKQEREMALVFLPILSLMLLLLMVTLLVSTIFGVSLGVEDLLVKDSMQAVGSVTPGRPSIATMLNFILIAILSFGLSFPPGLFNKVIILFGSAVSLVGLTAVAGYILNQRLLYFDISGKCSAMALHTAILFVLWGIGAMLTEKNK